MITRKAIVTGLIVNNLTIDIELHKADYWIGNNIKRSIVFDPIMTVGKAIVKYENSLNLESIEDNDKEIFWYNGVTNLIVTGDSYGQRAWFSNLD